MTKTWERLTKEGTASYYQSLIELQMVEEINSREEIERVILAETDKESAEMYAFEDFETGSLLFIFPSLYQVKMCSPDSFKTDIKEGKGRIVYLKVTQREKAYKRG